MDEQFSTALCEGLDEEIRCYEAMLALAREEQHILEATSSAREVMPLACRKLEQMRHVGEVNSRLAGLKMRWKREIEQGRADTPEAHEVTRRLQRLGDLLRQLLDIDLDNQRALSELIGAQAEARTTRPRTAEAARAYRATAARPT